MAYLNEEQLKKEKAPLPGYAEKKDNAYFLAWARYIFRNYLYNRTTVRAGGYTTSGKSFYLLRAYALGNQDTQIYMDILDKCEEGTTDKGFMNINWDIVKILPKFRDLVRGKMMQMEFDLNSQAIDEKSTKERTMKVNKMKLLADPRMQQAIAQVGIKPDMKLPEGVETPEDIDILDKMGGLRLEYEILIKDLYESSKYESDFQVLKDQMIDDILDFNICATRQYLEKKTGKVKIDRVNPMNLICKASNYPDHRDIDFAGEIKRKSISQLRAETNLTEAELADIANAYRSYAGNRGIDRAFSPYASNELYGINKQAFGYYGYNADYNDVSIEVMDFYFVAAEAEDFLVGAMPDKEKSEFLGEMQKAMSEEADEMFDSESEEEEKEESEKELKENKGIYQCVYHAQWVVGTTHVFDCGKEYGIVYEQADGVKRCKLPIQIYGDRTPSLVERCISFVDDIQLATLKKRNALQSLPPGPRMLIDKTRLRASVDMGGKSYDMLKLLNIFTKNGRLVYESGDEYNENDGSMPPPIQIMPGSGIMEDIQIFLQDIEFSINQIRNTTGINEVADGTSQQQDMLQGVMQGLNAATNNTLEPHFVVYRNQILQMAKYNVLKWQVAVLHGQISAKYAPFSDSALKTVIATKDLYDYDFGIMLTLKPTSQERQMLLQDLAAQKSQGAISTPDYFVIWNMIMTGDLKKAQLYYAKAVESAKAQAQQMQMQQLQAQGEANGKAAKMAEEAKMQSEMQILHTKIELERVKGEEERKTNKELHAQKMEEIQAQAGHQITQTTVDAALNGELPQDGQAPLLPPNA